MLTHSLRAAPPPITILPSANGIKLAQSTPGHGGPNIKATFTPDIIDIAFEHKRGADDYINIDLGKIPLSRYTPGGYVELKITNTAPIVQAQFWVGVPDYYWESRIPLGNLFTLQKGEHSYRFYLDDFVPSRRSTQNEDHLVLLIRDMKEMGIGKAQITIKKITVSPPITGWEQERDRYYARQYPALPDYERTEHLYREDFSRSVDWAELQSSPFVTTRALPSLWKKQFFGEQFWNPVFLSDLTPASPTYDDSTWLTTNIPEPQTPGQPGGYTWYRTEFEISPADAASIASGQQRFYLRCDDLSEDASLYINGTLAGTQTSVDKTLTWLGENINRTAYTPGTPLRDALRNRYFERYEIPMPFAADAIPVDAIRIPYPVAAGHFHWPLAYDIGALLKPGKNTLAIRLHGNPISGYWIYRHRHDRAAQNIFGILGTVHLAVQQNPAIDTLVRLGPRHVDSNGNATHTFTFTLTPAAQTISTHAILQSEGQRMEISLAEKSSGSKTVELALPARFGKATARLSLYDAQNRILDERTLTFNTSVVGVVDNKLHVNGDPFLVRGINTNAGVEWKNDRHTTRREVARLMRLYQQMGINTIRLESADAWPFNVAFEYGIMAMPLLANASTDLAPAAFGRLDNPDIDLALDRQRLGAILYGEIPNNLIWNVGNEIGYVPAGNAKVVVEKFLDAMPPIFKKFAPDNRPLMYSSYDLWVLDWFFFNTEIIGWNVYFDPMDLAWEIHHRQSAIAGRPYLFTEYGLDLNTRKKNIDQWEKDMAQIWKIISTSPGSLGGILYPWHGEMDDERGRAFMRSLYLPYEIKQDATKIIFTNRSEASMREILFQVVTAGVDVPSADLVPEIKPGESYELKLLQSPKKGDTLEIRYDTHHGLKHFFTERL